MTPLDGVHATVLQQILSLCSQSHFLLLLLTDPSQTPTSAPPVPSHDHTSEVREGEKKKWPEFRHSALSQDLIYLSRSCVRSLLTVKSWTPPPCRLRPRACQQLWWWYRKCTGGREKINTLYAWVNAHSLLDHSEQINTHMHTHTHTHTSGSQSEQHTGGSADRSGCVVIFQPLTVNISTTHWPKGWFFFKRQWSLFSREI